MPFENYVRAHIQRLRLHKPSPKNLVIVSLIGSRNSTNGEEAAASIDGEISAVALDLSDRHQLAQQVDSIIATYSSIEILVKNAGIYPPGQALEIDIDTVEDTLNVHMIGPWILSQKLIPLMIQAGYGRVVNVSSSGGGSFAEGLSPHHAAYGVSKVGLNALTFQLAQSVPRFVKVNAMCPGWVRTRMGGQSATRSPEQGADTAIWLATLPEEGVTGAFFAIANQLSGDAQKASIIIESQFIQSSFLRH